MRFPFLSTVIAFMCLCSNACFVLENLRGKRHLVLRLVSSNLTTVETSDDFLRAFVEERQA